MKTWLARLLDLIPTAARHYIPLNGIFAANWQASTALAVYWVESIALAAVAVALCWRLQRQASEPGAADRPDSDRSAAMSPRGQHAPPGMSGLSPGDVAAFHIGSLVVFGVFLGTIVALLTAKGHLPPFDWAEFRGAASALLVVTAFGFAVDLWLFPSMDAAAVHSRVNGCLARWALLWILGFVGTLLMVFSGRPGVFLGLFAILKVVFEGWGALARLFGWKSLQQREAERVAAADRG